MAPAPVFTDQQIATLIVLERTGGCLSLVAVLTIFIFYGLFKRLRTIPNTFLVFASIANVGASIPSVIAYSGMWKGTQSDLCQAQGFLFEMFIQSDPWWSLAMAINVLMVFFMGASPSTFKKWGWAYCVICYGGPLIIATVCLLLRDPNKGLVYGSAGLWCWISNDWNPLRIYTYYMLIWICILCTGVIYMAVGVHVFRARNKVRHFMGSNLYGTTTSISASANRPVVHDNIDDVSDAWPLPARALHSPLQGGGVEVVTEVRITSHQQGMSDAAPPLPLKSPDRVLVSSRAGEKLHRPGRRGPMSPGNQTTVMSPRSGVSSRQHQQKRTYWQTLVHRFMILDPIKRAYLRTSFLFALSVLVTWIPSSINRIRGLIYSDSPFPYNVATASVLPLQGVWNAVIFFVTSWTVVKECVGGVKEAIDSRRERKKHSKGVVELRERALDERQLRPAWPRSEQDDYSVELKEQKSRTPLDDEDRRRSPSSSDEEAGHPWGFRDIGVAHGGRVSPEESDFEEGRRYHPRR